MPISYAVDHKARVVVAIGYGVVTDADVFGYQHDAWSRSDVAGYNELVDMTKATTLDVRNVYRVRDLAKVAAGQDDPAVRTRFAIVAPDDVAYGLGRMFQTFREMDPRSTKDVQVFRTMPEALAFLGVERVMMPEAQ